MSRHFSHEHNQLKLSDQAGTIRGALCEICGEEVYANEVHFSCGYSWSDFGTTCKFVLHKTCKDFPRVLTHSFHPEHSLTLTHTPKRSTEFPRCNACGNFINSTYSYRCFDCDNFFMLDLKCATLVPLDSSSSSLSSYQISSHQHPLILCEQSINFEFQCGGCELSFDNRGFSSSPIYVCLTCKRLLHESCAGLPRNIINHPFHPQHSPLTQLNTLEISGQPILNWNFPCSACHESRTGFAFVCSKCPFMLDILCATIMLTNSKAGDHHRVSQMLRFYPSRQPHPLISCDVRDKSFGHSRPCFACHLPLKDSISFCVSCVIFLHKSCTQLPQQIQHIIHPLHPLTLHDSADHIRRSQPFSCKLCLEKCSSCFSYQCDPCDFKIEARCALQQIMYPMVKSELHNHPLVFSNSRPRPKLDTERIKCIKCNQKFEYPFLHCHGCHFYIHAHCLSRKSDLPRTVKHKCHLHPLSLTYSPIRDFPEEDGNAELYCDACEERRHLFHPTYYCQECHFVSHVHCVISEVSSYIREKEIAVGYANHVLMKVRLGLERLMKR